CGVSNIASAQTDPTPAPVNGVPGRLALSCDGNYHDRDDINSSAWELAMVAKSGRASDLVYFGYNDHYWLSNGTGSCPANWEACMTTSVNTSVSDWGINPAVIHNTVADHTAAVNALSAVINVSTVNNPLTIMEAGPAEVIGQALAASKISNPSALQFVTVITHSTWNDTHAKQVACTTNSPNEGLAPPCYSYSDFGTQGLALGANLLKLVFQANLNNPTYGQFAWAQTSPDVKLQHLYAAGVR